MSIYRIAPAIAGHSLQARSRFLKQFGGFRLNSRSLHIAVSSATLHVQTAGQGVPMLCLHGHPGSAQCMTVFTEPLSAQYQTIAPDLRGYGKSRAIAPFTMTDHLSDLETLLDALKIEDCWVLGWSLGGILAMELALSQPDRVRGLVLIATAARPRGSHPPITWQDNLNTGVASLINWVLPGWGWNIETFGKRSLYRYLIQQHTPTAYQYLADAAVTAYLQTSNPATQALRQALRKGYDRLPDVSQITCPSLVLAAECDRHITAESSRLTAAQLPNSQFHCYANVAHLFPWEIPKQVVGDIQTWLSQVPSPS